MKFKGSIVITDPCYVLKRNDYTNGYCMPEGFTNYICRDTIYGDWSCMTYRGTPDTDLLAQWNELYFNMFRAYNTPGTSDEDKKKLYEAFKLSKQAWLAENCYGEFCADAGEVCVVYLDEAIKYNPEFETFIKEHPWCVTVIEDFDGEVEEDVEDESLMLIGTGNKPFFTIQSGL